MKFFFSALLVPTVLALTLASSAQAASSGGITLDRLMKSGVKQFDKLDLNHDGIIDEAEWAAHVEDIIAKLRASQAKRWQEMDAQKQNKITKEQFLASRAKWFADVDSDNSGSIDGEKIRRYNFNRSKVPVAPQ